MKRNTLYAIVSTLIIMSPLVASADTLWQTTGVDISNANSGFVGIGTSTPAALLEISRDTGTATIAPASLRISTTGDDQDWDTTTSWGNLDFYSADTSGPGARVRTRIGAVDDRGTGRLTNMIFSVDDGLGTLTERMRLDFLGNVGIGTAVPGAKLDVKLDGEQLRLSYDDSNYASFTVDSSGDLLLSSTGSANTVTIQNYVRSNQPGTGTTPAFSNATLNAGMFFPGTDELAFDAGDLERVRIDANGNVGIGTATPRAMLDIHADSIIVDTAKTPASSSSACVQGTIAWDSGFVYVCTETNSWKRASLSSW